MTSNSANLSLYIGIAFITLGIGWVCFVYYIIKNKLVDDSGLNKFIELGKWFMISVAFVLGATIVTDSFREREQDMKEMEVFDRYISTITEVEGIEKRWLLTEYFASVSPEGTLRNSWVSYQKKLSPAYQEYRANKEKITVIENKVNPTKEEKIELVKLHQKTDLLEQSLAPAQPTNEEYLIIISADKTLPEAQFELNRALKLSAAAAIYKKHEYYCTIYGKYSSLEETKMALLEAKKLASDAYFVHYNKWCKKGVTSTKDCFICEN